MEGNLPFKIAWVSLIVGRKFTIFALFYFVFEGNFQVQAPGGLIFGGGGDLTEGFLHYEFGGLIHGGAYFRNFTVSTRYFSACSTILFNNVEQVMFNQLSRKLCLCYKVLIF